jgi:hypothetical protein
VKDLDGSSVSRLLPAFTTTRSVPIAVSGLYRHQYQDAVMMGWAGTSRSWW